MMTIFLISYCICTACSIAMVIAAILNKDCAERLDITNWGDVVFVSAISLIPILNVVPISMFFNFNNFIDKPIHKD